MMDDIDIEEHDLMENPMLKKIFPDLSIIKKEISAYEESGLHIESKPTPEVSSAETNAVQDSTKPINDIRDDTLLHSNVIILGSKPSSSVAKCVKSQLPRIVLQNVSSHLNKSKTYCKVCGILFANTQAFKLHLKQIHASSSNDVESRTTITKPLLPVKNFKKKYKCDLCSTYLSSSSNLIRHLRNIHEIERKVVERKKLRVRKEKSGTISFMNDTSPTVRVESHKCFHCEKLFLTSSLLVEHLYGVLEPKRKTDTTEIIAHDSDLLDENISRQNKIESKEAKNIVKNKMMRQSRTNVNQTKLNNIKTKLNTLGTDDSKTSKSKRMRKKLVKYSKLSVNKRDTKISNHISKKGKGLKKLNPMKDTNQPTDLNENISKEKAEQGTIPENDEMYEGSETPAKTIRCGYDKKSLVEKAYQCPICSHYIITYNKIAKHMINNHKMKYKMRLRKVVFDSQCLFCTSKLVNMASYNSHIIRSHGDKQFINYRNANKTDKSTKTKNGIVGGTFNLKPFAFKSVLYKCCKCDIHFLTARSAVNHTKHMEILINWKCLICDKIFKKCDKFLHVKQHSCSHTFNVYNVQNTDLDRVMYNCSRCAVHFSEDNYLTHHSRCGNETPSSAYCKNCDILISDSDYKAHEHRHKNDKLKRHDFTIVDANFLLYEDTKLGGPVENEYLDSNENSKTQSIVDKSTFLMTFCKLCGCFLSNIGIARKAHVEGSCVNVNKHVCKECGLVLTNKFIHSHRMLHKKIKNIKIQNYFFYDVKTKNHICPPIPEYPRCKVCAIHFLTRTEITTHECTKINFEICDVCHCKFTANALKLHVQFHQYSIEHAKEPTESVIEDHTANDYQPVVDITADAPSESSRSDLLFYTCKSCLITFDSYDKVVKHCQSYYDSTVSESIGIKCLQCSLNITKTDFKTHNESHESVTYDSKFIKILNFDPVYLRFDNEFWIKHIYGSLSDDDVNRIIEKSIYKFECRIKVEVRQSGLSDPTFYQCCKCDAFVNPISLYKHAENMSCNALQHHPCSNCEKVFVSMKYKMLHEKHHVGNSKLSHRIVKFNMKKDEAYHKTMFNSFKKFILYQCRNCVAVIEKFQRKSHRCLNELLRCVNCGLLFNKESYILHTTRHKELDYFNSSNMAVVLFGRDLGLTKKAKPSFNGLVMDYTFYKCNLCHLCLRTEIRTIRHKCVNEEYKHKCIKCNLYILRQEIASHSVLHDSNPEFTEYSLNIIMFNTSKNIQHDDDCRDKIDVQSVTCSDNSNKDITQILANLYRCDCGLHFMKEANFRSHSINCSPKMKISRQYCTKCGLLFNPEELFNHLLTHHADKKQVYRFEIINMSKTEDLSKSFKCVACSIYFIKEDVYNAHIQNCGSPRNLDAVHSDIEFNVINQEKSSSENCRTSHEVSLQDANNKNVDTLITDCDRIYAFEYDMTRKSLDKLDLSKYSNVIYKCNLCNVCYLTESTWIIHLRTCSKQKYSSLLDVCKICGLQFSLQSLSKHNYIHHEKFDLKKDEIVVKYSDDVEDMEEE